MKGVLPTAKLSSKSIVVVPPAAWRRQAENRIAVAFSTGISVRDSVAST
jgi:hypothetical protein